MNITLSPSSLDDYRRFLTIKSTPAYRIRGRSAWVPDEYAGRLFGGSAHTDIAKPGSASYVPPTWLFDYQRDIATMAIHKRKFCLFLECGLGKTAIILEFAKHCLSALGPRQRILIVSPLMVISQTLEEAKRFYGHSLPIDRISAADLSAWLDGGSEHASRIGITNYEAIKPTLSKTNTLGALILDESGMLKSHYGKWGTKLIELGAGLDWKLCATGTPAPNDRIEYANHAVFMDAFPSVNSFLSRFFVNRGQTDNRWEMKPHALRPFYRALSHWSIFVANPAAYGWRDNAETIPPIHVHEEDVSLTEEQRKLAFKSTGELFSNRIGGIVNRSVLSQIAKGSHKGTPVATNKPAHIRHMIERWSAQESTIVWCRFNNEQELLYEELEKSEILAHGGVASITGATPDGTRQQLVDNFKAGKIRTLITKPKILGFGLNLQIVTRQVFSSCEDSYELFHQATKRSNRIGSTRPLHVYLPVTDIERMQMENVLRKARLVQQDTEEQELIFQEMMVSRDDWDI